MDPASEQHVGNFLLDDGNELQVFLNRTTHTTTQVHVRTTSSNGSLVLHWGGIHDRKDGWVIPYQCPNGSTTYKSRALRTPFKKFGSCSCVTIEIDDPATQALEFVVHDESQNRWYKNNGENFHINLRKSELIPEDLVKIKAYLRWETKGKEVYGPEQQKDDYDTAQLELLEEIAKGSSIDDLRAELTKSNTRQGNRESFIAKLKGKIPDELVRIQAYKRWEKAGKPINSQEQQLKDFVEARLELQRELERGMSLDEIRKKVASEEILTKASRLGELPPDSVDDDEKQDLEISVDQIPSDMPRTKFSFKQCIIL